MCFRKWWYPQIIHFNRDFHYKSSILGYPYFWKHPYSDIKRCTVLVLFCFFFSGGIPEELFRYELVWVVHCSLGLGTLKVDFVSKNQAAVDLRCEHSESFTFHGHEFNVGITFVTPKPPRCPSFFFVCFFLLQMKCFIFESIF